MKTQQATSEVQGQPRGVWTLKWEAGAVPSLHPASFLLPPKDSPLPPSALFLCP